jgi:predicted dehydrogenase
VGERLDVAVAGAGSRGRYLGRAFNQDPRTRLVAVCDVSQAALSRAREEFGGDVRYFPSQQEMLEGTEFQVGVVASWDPAHRDNAVVFLEHDKHVYLEKPMAQTIADCDDILRAWERSSASLMVGLELRYCTLSQEIRRLLDAGEVGRVHLGMAVDNVSVGGQYYYHNNRRRKEFIRSLMLEKGTHTLDLMNWFIGASPTRVYGEGGLDVFGGDAPDDKRCRDCDERRSCPYFIDTSGFVMDYGETLKDAMDGCVWAREIDVDDNAVITVRYGNGAKMTYTECHFTPDYNRHFTLIGDRGRLYGFYNNEQEFVIRVQHRHDKTVHEYNPPHSAGGHGGGDPAILEAFIQQALAGTHVCTGALDARNSAAIAIAAAESCETHGAVAVPAYVGGGGLDNP